MLGVEAGDGVGGTWYWNRYPGARCDSESMYYSYSFLPEFEQEWPLDLRYPTQPVILRYLEAVAERLNLRPDFVFGARVDSVRYDDASALWEVRAGDRLAVTTRATSSRPPGRCPRRTGRGSTAPTTSPARSTRRRPGRPSRWT